MTKKENGWSKYEKFVLAKLEEISVQMTEHHEDTQKLMIMLHKQREDLVVLKTKLAIWGTVAFIVATTAGPAIAAYLIK